MNFSKTIAIGFLLSYPIIATHAAGVQFTGVNLAGAEFTDDRLQNGIPIHPPMLSVQRSASASDAALMFTTRAGFRYQPQMSATLDRPSWTNYGISYTGVAQVVNVWMRTSSNQHGFFRLTVTRLPSSRQTSGEFFESGEQQGTPALPRHVRDSAALIPNGSGETPVNPIAGAVADEDPTNRFR
jgi:hypothetical protein